MKNYKLSKILLVIFIIGLAFNLNVFAQDGYNFTIVKENKTTSVKNQYRSGTCWSFSGISFLESELIREGKGEFDLSEMFVVRYAYMEKAIKYVRLHGKLNFTGGGQLHDVINMIKKYGIVPEDVYSGKVIGEDNHIHGEMDAVLKNYVDAIVKNKNKKLSPVWIKGFNSLLDAYLGEVPETFTYKGKEYTPISFANKAMGLNMDDYIYIGSYTHHPFYSKFGIEIPDNWAWGGVYNLPLNEMMDVFDNSIEKGYTIAWASDVSENGFSWATGIAIIPFKSIADLTDLERTKWSKMTKDEKDKLVYHKDSPGKEKAITQEMRQIAFDNYKTTDDHGILITGIAKDQNGTKYYKAKNSWSERGNEYEGYFFASKAFVEYKTISILINKNSLPKKIAKKLGL